MYDVDLMVYDSYFIPSTRTPPQMNPKVHTIKQTFPANTIFWTPFMARHFLCVVAYATDFAGVPIVLISW
jgi:hypothetical protein